MIEIRKVKSIKENPDNPRIIVDDKFEKLKTSLTEFPEMINLRPIVIDENDMVLGGNMRLKAIQQLGWKEVPTIKVENLTQKQKDEFLIKDNVSYGQWDYDLLANEWDAPELRNWGLDVWVPVESDQGPFEADTAPVIGKKMVDESDIEKARESLKEQGKTPMNFYECVCPKCAHEFKIAVE